MKIIEKFIINDSSWMEVVVIDLNEDDDSVMYEQQMQAIVVVRSNQESITIYKNTVSDIFFRIRILLYKILNRGAVISDKRFIGSVGKHYVIDEYHNWKNDYTDSQAFDYTDYVLFESNHINTWLYCDGFSMYLEIGHTLFGQLNAQELPKYITSYKPIQCISFSIEQAQKWLDQCNKIIKILLGSEHCCLEMEGALENSIDSPITYQSHSRNYTISAPTVLLKKNEVWIGYAVIFCPFCGIRLPIDLTDKRMEIVEKEYGIDDMYDDEQKKRIPQEFMTDEWWKKRGL